MDPSPSWRHQHVPPPREPPSEPFTPAMRARQARGQDPYQGSEDGSERSGGGDGRKKKNGTTDNPWMGLSGGVDGSAARKGDAADVERRDLAVAYLSKPGLLMTYAQSTGESVSAARLHFMRVMCGCDEDRDDPTRGGRGAGESKGRAKGKGGGKKPKRSAALAFVRAGDDFPLGDDEGTSGG